MWALSRDTHPHDQRTWVSECTLKPWVRSGSSAWAQHWSRLHRCGVLCLALLGFCSAVFVRHYQLWADKQANLTSAWVNRTGRWERLLSHCSRHRLSITLLVRTDSWVSQGMESFVNKTLSFWAVRMRYMKHNGQEKAVGNQMKRSKIFGVLCLLGFTRHGALNLPIIWSNNNISILSLGREKKFVLNSSRLNNLDFCLWMW